MITSFKLEERLKERINDLLSGTESISQFAQRATEEKVNRMEVRNKIVRLELFKKDLKTLKPFILEILKEEGLI